MSCTRQIKRIARLTTISAVYCVCDVFKVLAPACEVFKVLAPACEVFKVLAPACEVFKGMCPKIPLCVICVHSYTNML